MSESLANAYARIKGAAQADPALMGAMLHDLPGTLAERFGLRLDAPARLERSGDGYRLTLNGRSYELADPARAAPGELDEAELELVSGGDAAADCKWFWTGNKSSDSANQMTDERINGRA